MLVCPCLKSKNATPTTRACKQSRNFFSASRICRRRYGVAPRAHRDEIVIRLVHDEPHGGIDAEDMAFEGKSRRPVVAFVGSWVTHCAIGMTALSPDEPRRAGAGDHVG
jgi:hypothetical protein